MEHLGAYLQEAVGLEYFGTLLSRWPPLLQRIGSNTQAVQSGSDLQQKGVLLRQELENDFSLAQQLLDMEHHIYRVGMGLFHDLESTSKSSELSVFRRQLNMFLKGMLNGLSVKEVILADWRSSVDTISANTLRIYTQCLLSPKEVHLGDVDRLLTLMPESKNNGL
ncbi:unnamed protein product [Phytomonas sp. EM1]|nr:unnamed protein product [Phytomonas sp. EM1]|eukprot:CCW65805.1 unnamed protein product [Phytomonas sp. isolate EM1]